MPVAPQTRSEAVAAELRRLIQAGDLGPGQRLRQAEIAARFGVSTTPVREAFMVLAREGFVRQDAHRGVVVFEPSLNELTETYEIRRVLEPLATGLAADRITEEELDSLQATLGEMRSASPPRYAELNREFHRRIYAAAGRPRLLEMIERLREVAASYVGLTVRRYDRAYADQVHAEHEAIHEALRQRDGERAAALIRDHLSHNAKQVAALLGREANGHASEEVPLADRNDLSSNR